MRILIVCTKYSLDADNPSMLDELARALGAQGHAVSVMVGDWSGAMRCSAENKDSNGIEVFIKGPVEMGFGPPALRKAAKWSFTSARLLRRALELRRTFEPDLVIGSSPAVTMLLPLLLLRLTSRARAFFIQWDFFPIHHVEIGKIKNPAMAWVLKKLENFMMRRFEVIGCMSPMNVAYLQRHYRLNDQQRTMVLPIWSSFPPFTRADRTEMRRKYALPLDMPLFVFGGQLNVGRGIDDILEVAELAYRRGVQCGFVFIGSGSAEEKIRSYIAMKRGSVFLLDGIPRSSYLTFLSACDVGIVSTVRGVSVPTFPSKTLDYLHARLPILASVEECTDFGDFIAGNGLGLSVPAGNIEAFVTAVEKFAGDGSKLEFPRGETLRQAIDRFYVSNVASQIVNQFQS